MMEILEAINESIQRADEEYMGDDGLLHCGKCHTPVQTRIHIFGTDKIVRCVCGCIKAEREAEAAEYLAETAEEAVEEAPAAEEVATEE